jgi:serine/threonine protein kinase/tetratricopeptide (TPR) repeat protein
LGVSGEKPVESIKPEQPIKPIEPIEHPKSIEYTRTLKTPIQELTTGSTFAGKYQIIEEIGKGGMGRVYKAQDTEIREKVALKLIKPEIVADEKTVERFRNELKFTRKIRHKNVCQMYDLNKEEETYYITMEYVSGDDLKSLIRKMGHLSTGQAITIANQICDGLEEAHNVGVVHRDLKPSNIMIDRDGNARIMDFGIARSLKEKGITGAGVMIGTPEYMSPEQVEGKDVDQRSDIYSLGVILYEMVAGRVPFEGDTPFTVGVKHKSESPQDPREFNTQIPENLSNIILKCLEKDKDARNQNAAEVRSELEKIAQGIPTTERTVPKRTPITSKEITVQFSLKKALIPALVFAVIVVIGIIIWNLFLKRTGTPLPSGKPSLAVINFENRSDEPYLDKMIADMLVSNLSRIEEIEVVSSLRLYDILKELGEKEAGSTDASLATEVANRTGANTMLSGSINKVGEHIRIISQLIDVDSGKIIASPQVEGEGSDEVFQMADSLAALIVTELGVSTEADEQTFKISDVTTDSIEAYKLYQEGLDKLWRWSFGPAHDAFKKALEIDPSFVMAYYHLAMAMGASGTILGNYNADLRPIRELYVEAEKYVSEVSEKEHMLIDAGSAMFNREYERAITISQRLIERYPKSINGYWVLGMSSLMNGDIQGYGEALETLLEIDPTFADAYNMLALYYILQKDYRNAISTIKKYTALLPTNSNPYDSSWEIYVSAGEFDEAIRICEEALDLMPKRLGFHWTMGLTYLFKGDTEKARSKFQQLFSLAENPRPSGKAQNYGYSYIVEGKFEEAYVEFQRMVDFALEEGNPERIRRFQLHLGKILVELGRYDEAIEVFREIEVSSQESPPTRRLNLYPIIARTNIGLAYVKQGDHVRAESMAEEIKRIIEREEYETFLLDYYYRVMGELYSAQMKIDMARMTLDKISPFKRIMSSHTHIMKAAILEDDGDYEGAIEVLKIFYGSSHLFRYGSTDQVLFLRERFRVDYNIARLYEKMGERDKAVEHYDRFLELAKNADEGLVEVDDAKKRLTSLRGE